MRLVFPLQCWGWVLHFSQSARSIFLEGVLLSFQQPSQTTWWRSRFHAEQLMQEASIQYVFSVLHRLEARPSVTSAYRVESAAERIVSSTQGATLWNLPVLIRGMRRGCEWLWKVRRADGVAVPAGWNYSPDLPPSPFSPPSPSPPPPFNSPPPPPPTLLDGLAAFSEWEGFSVAERDRESGGTMSGVLCGQCWMIGPGCGAGGRESSWCSLFTLLLSEMFWIHFWALQFVLLRS